MSATCRMYVDLPPMFGPVMSSSLRDAESRASFATNVSTCDSTTGWRPALDVDAVVVDELRCHQVECVGAFGERRQHVEFRECPGSRLQGRDGRHQCIEQRLVEQLLACERAVLGGQRAVLEGLSVPA
jgi:hypothetical protein